ncbi:MAG TPA: DUF4190 domain-containing protein [Candidatus Saccharibacteria bacterium]|nr:DUF4190 domain-containing protein [Candidatus Saccharibacteria bacterium]
MKDQVKTPQKTNALAVIGLVSAFFVPLVGLVLSIIGLVQVNKKKEKGKGLAIAGIVSSVVVGLLQILTLVLIISAVSNSKVELVTYANNDIGYSVKYPKGWEKTVNDTAESKEVVFKKSLGETGKVYGQVDVGYIPVPEGRYPKDILNLLADTLKNDNPETVVLYRDRSTVNDRQKVTMITTYKSEESRIKAKTTIMLNPDKSIYVISTQTPEENWDKYSDAFDEIHNTFSP